MIRITQKRGVYLRLTFDPPDTGTVMSAVWNNSGAPVHPIAAGSTAYEAIHTPAEAAAILRALGSRLDDP